MEVKEAIEIVKSLMDFFVFPASARIISGKEAEKYRQKRDEVISLLQQGEKYRQMWEEISKGKYALIEFDNEGYAKVGTKSFISIKQKYFPKEEKDEK